MKKIQNFFFAQSQNTSQCSRISSTPVTQTHQPVQKKSIQKFNRKTQISLISHKPSRLELYSQSPICFISPKKSLVTQENFFKSPQFQITQIFRDTLKQKDLRASLGLNQLTQKMQKKGKHKLKNQFNKSDLQCQKKEKDTLLCQIEQLKKQNNSLSKKLKEFQNLREFLLERENFIYEISQLNIKNQEHWGQISQKNTELTHKLAAAQNQLKEEKEKFRKLNEQVQLFNQNQKREVQSHQNEIQTLKEEVRYLKEQSLQFNQFSKRFKEDQNAFSLRRTRNPLRSKSAVILSQLIQPTLYKGCNEMKVFQEDNKQNQHKGILNGLQLISQRDESDSFLSYRQANSEILNEIENQQKSQSTQECQIKKLKQKIRYCEIQIDVLNKVKADSQKIKTQNEKFKALNKKYLNRIQYFSKRLSRRCGSDSSLQLSLTPKKRNDLN